MDLRKGYVVCLLQGPIWKSITWLDETAMAIIEKVSFLSDLWDKIATCAPCVVVYVVASSQKPFVVGKVIIACGVSG
jgi:hypothetical protein